MNLEEDELENLRDGDLFKIMADDVEKSEIAFNVFYERYKDDFHKLVCRISFDQSVVEDLVVTTMEEAYFKANTFKGDNSLSLRSERGKTLAWLGKIAKNVFNQNFRNAKKDIKTVPQKDDFGNDDSLTEKATENGFIAKGELYQQVREAEDNILGANNLVKTNITSLEKEILLEVLSELSERDKGVLLDCFDEYDPEIENQKLSKEKIKELCERYNITPDNIRQIKLRTFKKVRDKCLKIKAKKWSQKYE